MRRHFQKSTKSDINKILKMSCSGKSSIFIGKKLNKDHTTILYWINKAKEFKKVNGDNFIFKNVIIKMPKKKVEKEPKKKVEKEPKPLAHNICPICKEIKSKSWANTGYCSLNCWHKATKKLEYYYW